MKIFIIIILLVSNIIYSRDGQYNKIRYEEPISNIPDSLGIIIENDYTTYNFSFFIHDEDTNFEDLNITISGNYNIDILQSNKNFVFSINDQNWTGSEEVIFTISDNLYSITDTVTVYTINNSTYPYAMPLSLNNQYFYSVLYQDDEAGIWAVLDTYSKIENEITIGYQKYYEYRYRDRWNELFGYSNVDIIWYLRSDSEGIYIYI